MSFSDLISTVAVTLGLNTGSAEREAEETTISIHKHVFLVSNLQGVDFSDVFGTPFTVPDSTRPLEDLTYFTFRSVSFAATIDIRAPE